MQNYRPNPLLTDGIVLSPTILELTERLAENIHEVWSQGRLNDGWRYGPQRDDAKKEHPSLIPYNQLSESEREYDRSTALQTLKTMIALGYRIEKD